MEGKFNLIMATDYSDTVADAEKYAIQFAFATGSGLKFVHITEPVPVATDVLYQTDQQGNDIADPDEDALKEHVTKRIKSTGISPDALNFQCHIHEGRGIEKLILHEADEHPTDFIIMG